MATKRKSGPSGPTIPYAERKKRGRPIVGFSLPQDVVDTITRLTQRMGLNRSEVVEQAVRRLAKYLDAKDA